MVPGTEPPRQRNSDEKDERRLALKLPKKLQKIPGFIDFLVNMILVSMLLSVYFLVVGCTQE